ncbi:hypothetical protein LCGC14_2847120 [marine sediment metagenome]|uniref:Uncharacterized protein n=1 Tax=marine sediment metagenome TaxID=412755 RepID=A0A0F8YW79_9ZZZZ
MHWMKIIVLVLFAYSSIYRIAQAGGFKAKPSHPVVYAICAVLFALGFVGVWVYL